MATMSRKVEREAGSRPVREKAPQCFGAKSFDHGRYSSGVTRRDWIPSRDALGGFGDGRRKRACLDDGCEPAGLVGAVAEGFVGGLSAAAERDGRAPAEIEGLSLLIEDLEVSLDPDRTVVANRD